MAASKPAIHLPRVTYRDPVTGRRLTDREHAIIEAHRWQVAHGAENLPTPSDAYTVIVGLLSLLPEREIRAALQKVNLPGR